MSYSLSTHIGQCSAITPADVREILDIRCTDSYTLLAGSDTTDYGPYWTSWPPMDGTSPLDGVTDDVTLTFYDAFKFTHKG